MIVFPDTEGPANKERGSSKQIGVVAEPVNLMSNIIFAIVGIIALQYCQDKIDYWLSLHVILIGIFSFVSHLHYNKTTMVFDNVVIATFVIFYVGMFLFYMIDIPIGWATTLFGIWLMFGYFCNFSYARNWMNTAFDFMPVLAAVWGAAIYTVVTIGSVNFFVSAILATLALVARTADFNTPLKCGTHFIWHILTGSLLMNLLLTKLFW